MSREVRQEVSWYNYKRKLFGTQTMMHTITSMATGLTYKDSAWTLTKAFVQMASMKLIVFWRKSQTSSIENQRAKKMSTICRFYQDYIIVFSCKAKAYQKIRQQFLCDHLLHGGKDGIQRRFVQVSSHSQQILYLSLNICF